MRVDHVRMRVGYRAACRTAHVRPMVANRAMRAYRYGRRSSSAARRPVRRGPGRLWRTLYSAAFALGILSLLSSGNGDLACIVGAIWLGIACR